MADPACWCAHRAVIHHKMSSHGCDRSGTTLSPNRRPRTNKINDLLHTRPLKLSKTGLTLTRLVDADQQAVEAALEHDVAGERQITPERQFDQLQEAAVEGGHRAVGQQQVEVGL